MKIFIENKNPKFYDLVIPVLEMLGGVNPYKYTGLPNNIYYIRDDSHIISVTIPGKEKFLNSGYTEIDLEKLANLFNSKTTNVFPKVMKVWNNNTQPITRVVIGINPINNKYLAVNGVDTIEAVKDDKYLGFAEWDYIEDIIENPIIELSLQDIANKLNIPVEQIRIKD